MKNKYLTLLSTFSFLLISCGSMKNEGAINAMMSVDKEAIEIKSFSLSYLIDNNYSFPLLMYTRECSACDEAKINLSNYLKGKNICAYQIEMYSASIDYLNNRYPELFSKEKSYPNMLIFKEGKISYEFDNSTLLNYTSFKRVMNNQIIESSVYKINTLEGYNSFISNHKSYLFYIYSSDTLDEVDVYKKYIYPSVNKSNKNILIIDQYTAKSDLISQISSTYDIPEDKKMTLISAFLKWNEIRTIDYSKSDETTITNLVDSFFDFNTVDSSL